LRTGPGVGTGERRGENRAVIRRKSGYKTLAADEASFRDFGSKSV